LTLGYLFAIIYSDAKESRWPKKSTWNWQGCLPILVYSDILIMLDVLKNIW